MYLEVVGEVEVPIVLENGADAFLQAQGQLPDSRVRRFEGIGTLDTGAVILAIPQEISESLDLVTTGKVVVSLDDESRLELSIAGPLNLSVGGRKMATDAVLLPHGSKISIGQIVLRRLDLLVDFQNQTLIPRPESPVYPSLKL